MSTIIELQSAHITPVGRDDTIKQSTLASHSRMADAVIQSGPDSTDAGTLLERQSLSHKIIRPRPSATVSSMTQVVRCALFDCPYRELRTIHVSVEPETVRLAGNTSSFFLKQMAQEVVRKVAGEMRIDNQIVVLPPMD